MPIEYASVKKKGKGLSADISLAEELLLKFVGDNSLLYIMIFSNNYLWDNLLLEIKDKKIIRWRSEEMEFYTHLFKNYRINDWRKDYKGLIRTMNKYLEFPFCNGLFMSRSTFNNILESKERLYTFVEAIISKDIITEPSDLFINGLEKFY